MKRRTERRGGFTLMEVTLATLVAVVIAMSLYASMNIAVKARRAVQAAVDPAREISIVGEMLTRRLGSVPPPAGVLAGAFIGTPKGGQGARSDTLTFFSFDDDDDADQSTEKAPAGIVAVELTAVRSGSSFTLVERVRRNLLATVANPVEETVLCRNVASFEARYFDGSLWSETWDSTAAGNALPVAVELTVSMPAPADGGTPTQIVRVVPLACSSPAATDSTGVLP